MPLSIDEEASIEYLTPWLESINDSFRLWCFELSSMCFLSSPRVDSSDTVISVWSICGKLIRTFHCCTVYLTLFSFMWLVLRGEQGPVGLGFALCVIVHFACFLRRVALYMLPQICPSVRPSHFVIVSKQGNTEGCSLRRRVAQCL